ncbi:MAG: hypothetical protein AAF688_01710 [Bacteroidota bacterium]
MKTSVLAILLFSFFSVSLFGQSGDGEVLIEGFERYVKLPREVAYTHLNKDTYVVGEDIAFKTYLFDKNSRSLSDASKIIYCTLEDLDGNVLKEQMLYSERGFANGIIETNDSLRTGLYIFKAYTNWMRNFNEANGTVSAITILNPDQPQQTTYADSSKPLDVQFLPEGGHLVSNATNTVGVAIKDRNGKGVQNLYGTVLDQDNEEVANFNTNGFGYSKFEFNPNAAGRYRVIFQEYPNNSYNIPPSEKLGINVAFNELNDKLAIQLRTNEETLPQLEGAGFKLSIHNGRQLKYIDIDFSQGTEVLNVISKNDLYPGTNIFTLFNEKDEPILERLYFNYNGLKIAEPKGQLKVLKTKDSVKIRALFASSRVTDSLPSSLSVSILPLGSVSAKPNQTILSKIYLEPFIKRPIQNVSHYFGETGTKTRTDMDLLLLNQGWSSYDWDRIFNNRPEIKHRVESGIEITANGLDPKTEQLVVYPMKNTNMVTIDIADGQKSARIKGLVPVDTEVLNLSVVNKRGKSSKPGIYVQFKPTTIPTYNFSSGNGSFRDRVRLNLEDNIGDRDFNNKDATKLDEVLVKAEVEETRLEKLKQRYAGLVDVFDKVDRASNINLFSYISSKGYAITPNKENPFLTEIYLPRPISLPSNFEGIVDEIQKPLIYLDGQLLFDQRIIQNFDMSLVDYIVVDKQGLGEGIRGAAGVIRIFTDPFIKLEPWEFSETQKSYKFPLTFSKPKNFYVPLYNDYSNDFFKKYGVIDWKPDLSINKKGQVDFQIKNLGYSGLLLLMEGIDSGGNFISEIKEINL